MREAALHFMGIRSSKVIEILRQTVAKAEETPELGAHDPGVVELRRILEQWTAERDRALGEVSAGKSSYRRVQPPEGQA